MFLSLLEIIVVSILLHMIFEATCDSASSVIISPRISWLLLTIVKQEERCAIHHIALFGSILTGVHADRGQTRRRLNHPSLQVRVLLPSLLRSKVLMIRGCRHWYISGSLKPI